MPESRAFSDLVSALIRLRQSLDDVALPLGTDGAEEARANRRTTVEQLDNYVLPRMLQLDAPLVAVVGGSTGAGKSTLVNSLVGSTVSPTGVLRPTTRAPVLVHHPDDSAWFAADRILPDLPRAGSDTATADALQLVAAPGMPPGLALLDAPDVDSVVRANHDLAAQLLAAADLWLFVTSESRYADQVPWEVLADAARRSTAVAVVLDRTAPEHASEVRSHLARMLTSRGLRDSPLFDVPEAPLDDGLLPGEAVASVREWLLELAADESARGGIVERSLLGTLRSLVYAAHQVADAAWAQAIATDQLRTDVQAVYAEVTDAARAEVETGGLLRGAVLTRWQELAAVGEPERWADPQPLGVRARLSALVRHRYGSVVRLEAAVADSVSAALVDASGRAAREVGERWHEQAPGDPTGPGEELAPAISTDELRTRAAEQASQWQAAALGEVSTALAAVELDPDRLAGVAVLLQVAAIGRGSRSADDPAAATRVRAAERALTVLGNAIDADATAMVERLAADLSARVTGMLAADRDHWLAAVEGLGTDMDSVDRIREAARSVDDRRPLGDAT